MKDKVLDAFFEPRGVAFFGSIRQGKIGHEILMSVKEGGYPGHVYPINPAGGEVLGYRVYRSLEDLEGKADLAVISLPQAAVVDTIAQCGMKRIRAAVVISSGFSEVGNHEAEKDLTVTARKWGVRVIGPNCAGLMNPWVHHYPSIEVRALPGHTAFVTQSGALGGATLALAEERGFGFSKFVSYGNRCDVGDIELLSYLAEDTQTRVVALYIEGIDRGHDFLGVARATSLRKPLVVIKSGRTRAGIRAASSHTGTLAGDDAIYEAVFRKAGMVRVEGIEEMFDLCQGLCQCPLPDGKRVAIVTNSGGPGILAADRAERLGLDVAEPSGSLQKKLVPLLSPHASMKNPIDLTVQSGYEEYGTVLRCVLEEYDSVIAINVATPALDSIGIARGVIEVVKESRKPVLASFMAGRVVRDAVDLMRREGVVNLATGERCALVVSKMFERKRILEGMREAGARPSSREISEGPGRS
jgi:acyl-CoA synthetase (NDP forming)